jgi:hypothetical protein
LLEAVVFGFIAFELVMPGAACEAGKESANWTPGTPAEEFCELEEQFRSGAESQSEGEVWLKHWTAMKSATGSQQKCVRA